MPEATLRGYLLLARMVVGGDRCVAVSRVVRHGRRRLGSAGVRPSCDTRGEAQSFGQNFNMQIMSSFIVKYLLKCTKVLFKYLMTKWRQNTKFLRKSARANLSFHYEVWSWHHALHALNRIGAKLRSCIKGGMWEVQFFCQYLNKQIMSSFIFWNTQSVVQVLDDKMSVKNKFPEKVHMGKLVLQILIFARKLSIYSSIVKVV